MFIFKTFCPICQHNLLVELEPPAAREKPRTLDAYCQHNGVAINVMVAAGDVVHWNCYPVRDEADWERIVGLR